MKKVIQYINYLAFRFFSALLSLFPHKALYQLGNGIGLLAYFGHCEFRKKCMTNLAIAFPTLPEKKRVEIAKRSFQNLAITMLEFAWFKPKSNRLTRLIRTEGGEELLELLNKKKSIVFMSAHQANWEVPFLFVTQLFPGVAIGRPTKNPWIYRYVQRVREMNGGKIIPPKRAIKESLQYLQEGKFVGIVADQALPQSGYCYPLFGTRAWTSPMPALLAIRSQSPLVVAFTRREKEHYRLTVSKALWPNSEAPLKEEVPRLMNEAMALLEKSIAEKPEDWLWQHDRFKQQSTDHLKRDYRYGFILILLPRDPTPLLPLIEMLQKIYHRSFLTFFAPKGCSLTLPDATCRFYEKEQEFCERDWRYQLLFDFYDSPMARNYYKKLGVMRTVTLDKIQKIGKDPDLTMALKKTLLKPHALGHY